MGLATRTGLVLVPVKEHLQKSTEARALAEAKGTALFVEPAATAKRSEKEAKVENTLDGLTKPIFTNIPR